MGGNIAIDANWNSASFWQAPPGLPGGLSLVRQHTLWFGQRPGPGGQDSFEEVLLRAPSADTRLLVAYKAPLTVRDIPSLKKRLQSVIEDRRRNPRDDQDRLPWVPAVATDSAQPAVKAGCEREWLGLLDQRGTVIVHEGPVYVHVQGTQKVKRRLRSTLFTGKGARILRYLLDVPGPSHQAREVADFTQTSFAYTYAVLTRLEDEGYVERRSPRTGFRLTRPVDLVKAWVESGARTAVVVEPFYAPSTNPQDLDRLAKRLEDARAPFAFTLQSAIPPDEVAVGGLPHGIYLNGDPGLVVEELKLRKITPHNFLVLRPGPADATGQAGVYRDGRRLVARPQLILDLEALGGPRGHEQAEQLLKRWAAALPLPTAGSDE